MLIQKSKLRLKAKRGCESSKLETMDIISESQYEIVKDICLKIASGALVLGWVSAWLIHLKYLIKSFSYVRTLNI